MEARRVKTSEAGRAADRTSLPIESPAVGICSAKTSSVGRFDHEDERAEEIWR
jgi:hypothetical protein